MRKLCMLTLFRIHAVKQLITQGSRKLCISKGKNQDVQGKKLFSSHCNVQWAGKIISKDKSEAR